MKKLFSSVLLFVCASFAFAAADLSGTWSVKSTVNMSSCPDMPVKRTTTEQWVINQVDGEKYQAQVIGNIITGMIYDGQYLSDKDSGIFLGRYLEGGKNWTTKIGMSEVNVYVDKGKAAGMRAYVRYPNKECIALSSLEFKKID